MERNFNLNVEVNDNTIELVEVCYKFIEPFSCYVEWTGTFKIIKSDRPVTQADIDKLKADGFFGYGQTVSAFLEDNFIQYNGIRDSSD